MYSRFKLRSWARVTAVNAVLLFYLLTAAVAHAQRLRVAIAADLQFTMNDLVAKYRPKSEQVAEVDYGASGNFLVQIQNRRSFDLFFSADATFSTQRVDQGLSDIGISSDREATQCVVIQGLFEHQSVLTISVSKHQRAAADFLDCVNSAEDRPIIGQYSFNRAPLSTIGELNP